MPTTQVARARKIVSSARPQSEIGPKTVASEPSLASARRRRSPTLPSVAPGMKTTTRSVRSAKVDMP